MQKLLTEWHRFLKEKRGISFYDLIDLAKDGDTLRLKFSQPATDMGFTVFKPGPTYGAVVKNGKIIIQHEKVFFDSFSTLTKEELKQKLRKQDNPPCVVMDCRVSTVTRNNRTLSIAAVMENPRLAEPQPMPKPKPLPQPTPTPRQPVKKIPAETIEAIKKKCWKRYSLDTSCAKAMLKKATTKGPPETTPARKKGCWKRYSLDTRCD